MSEVDKIDVNIEEYIRSGKEIPGSGSVKNYTVKVDGNEIKVDSLSTGKDILNQSSIDPSKYQLKKCIIGGTSVDIELGERINFTDLAIEGFVCISNEISIIVNGREKLVTKKSLSYFDLIQLAFDNPPTGKDVTITISYRNGPKEKPEGTLVKGEEIEIKNGMVFNVKPTDKS